MDASSGWGLRLLFYAFLKIIANYFSNIFRGYMRNHNSSSGGELLELRLLEKTARHIFIIVDVQFFRDSKI